MLEKRNYTLNHRSVLLVIPPYLVPQEKDARRKGVRSFLAFPYGALTLASFAERNCRHKIQIKILDLNVYPDEERDLVLDKNLTDMNPKFVGISLAFDVSYRYVRPLSQRIKNFDKDIVLLMGGPAVTVSWQDILEEQDLVDAVCYGEGEIALRDLLDADDFKTVLANDPWITRGEKKFPNFKVSENIDDVLDVNYELIDIKRYSMKEAFSPFVMYRNEDDARQFFIVTSRGCPFKCVFCAEPSFHGKSMRFASVEKVVSHVGFLVDRYGMNVLTIYDDQLLIDRSRAKELFRRLAEFHLRIEMPNGITVAYIDEELAVLMKAAGVNSVSLAIESGSDHVLHNIIRKPLKSEKVAPVVSALQRQDIFVQAFFINGFPGERPIDRQETLKKIKEWGIDWALFNFATPLRGSELFKQCRDNNWIDEKYLKIGEVDMTKAIIKAPGLDVDEIEVETYNMNLDANFVNNYRMKIGDYSTAARCFEEVIERHPAQPFARYFLAEAYRRLGRNVMADQQMKIFKEIVENDEIWNKRARQFALI